MGSPNCMNEFCRGTTSSEWKRGWNLKQGGFAVLCYRCGSAYENSVFCETFHSEESGWRECRICGKRIHCGCVASRNLHEYMDLGGVGCINCLKNLEIHSVQSLKVPSDVSNGTVTKNGIKDVDPVVVENRINDNIFRTQNLPQPTKATGTIDGSSGPEQPKRERLPNCTQQSSPSTFYKTYNRPREGAKNMFESLARPSLNLSLTTLSGSSNSILPFPGGIVGESKQRRVSLREALHSLPKHSKPSSEKNREPVSQARAAKPPAEGRGRNQLLPRYWPRVTNQELQRLSGDLKSNIVPLFEKVLSASDAGRIGRLVLPKACAEAFFPLIDQSEGIPIRIQDIKGNEWTFQFRFWPNNNSRMYVLEGVNACIQNMQVQAGDTVIFSRTEPGGQLVIGCRKAINDDDAQDSQTPASTSGDTCSGANSDSLLNGGKCDDSLQQSKSEKKKAKNIKNKRLLMNNDDVVELRITWEEAQELLRPSPTAEPTVVVIEDHEFEEFEEPPIFGTRTVFTSGALGHSCSVPDDISLKDPEPSIPSYEDSKKSKISEENVAEGETSGLDTLANAAILGDNITDTAAVTTRHPRHRPGCSCIVCIQPPSGQGKHDPTCRCNVCSTVRRRFKTLTMRKKRRLSVSEHVKEREDVGRDDTRSQTNERREQLDLNCDPRHEDDDYECQLALANCG